MSGDDRVGPLEEDTTEAPNDSPGEGAPSSLDDVDVRDLLRRALDPAEGMRSTTVLHDVHRKLRDETQGRFFADGWGTSPAPTQTYLVTAAVLLALLLAAWLLLAPFDVQRL